jgi:hypothetical protein
MQRRQVDVPASQNMTAVLIRLCKCSNAKGPAPLASRVDMVDIDNAMGEEEILAVLSHEVEDEALYFQVSWMSGET